MLAFLFKSVRMNGTGKTLHLNPCHSSDSLKIPPSLSFPHPIREHSGLGEQFKVYQAATLSKGRKPWCVDITSSTCKPFPCKWGCEKKTTSFSSPSPPGDFQHQHLDNTSSCPGRWLCLSLPVGATLPLGLSARGSPLSENNWG